MMEVDEISKEGPLLLSEENSEDNKFIVETFFIYYPSCRNKVKVSNDTLPWELMPEEAFVIGFYASIVSLVNDELERTEPFDNSQNVGIYKSYHASGNEIQQFSELYNILSMIGIVTSNPDSHIQILSRIRFLAIHGYWDPLWDIDEHTTNVNNLPIFDEQIVPFFREYIGKNVKRYRKYLRLFEASIASLHHFENSRTLPKSYDDLKSLFDEPLLYSILGCYNFIEYNQMLASKRAQRGFEIISSYDVDEVRQLDCESPTLDSINYLTSSKISDCFNLDFDFDSSFRLDDNNLPSSTEPEKLTPTTLTDNLKSIDSERSLSSSEIANYYVAIAKNLKAVESVTT